VTAVDDPLTLTFTNTPVDVNKDKVPVVLDPTATLVDPDTTVNFANGRIVANITDGSKAESLVVSDGALTVKGKKILFGTTLIAKTKGGKKGKALEINFTEVATQEAVTAVLRQLSIEASKKSVSGPRTVQVTVTNSDGTSTATGTVGANVV
jgi:hypothetical protein